MVFSWSKVKEREEHNDKIVNIIIIILIIILFDSRKLLKVNIAPVFKSHKPQGNKWV